MGLGTGPDNNVLGWGEVHENLPVPVGETLPIKTRASRYGGIYVEPVFPGKQALLQEGSLYVLTNPTIGTQVTYAVVASYSNAQAAFAIKNSWGLTDPQACNIFLDYVKLSFTGTPVVPASAISAIMSVAVDDTARTPTAGQRGPDTPVNCSMKSGRTSKAQIYQFAAGVMTVPAPGPSARFLGRTVLKSAIPVTQDELVCYFANGDAGGPNIGTAAGRNVSALQGCMIGPQQWAVVNVWFPSNATTAGQFEYEIGIIER